MKLIIQIPCYNEEETLPQTVADLPRRIEGVDEIEVLIVDDGSTDGTVEVARRLGVDHILRHTRNQGLASAFGTGLDACLQLGADLIVNTDGDNQYCGQDIPKLVQPLLEGSADLVVGDRQTRKLKGFSNSKKLLQRLGSLIVRRLSSTHVPDAVSGFRALTREAALRINIFSSFSYTIEMLIQAGKKQMSVRSVPIRVNRKTRDSRLFRNVSHFVAQSSATMVRTYTMYNALRAFTYIGILLGILGAAPVVRFLYFYSVGEGTGHIQSLVLGAGLLVAGFVTILIGAVSDLISSNRKLLEVVLEKLRRLELEAGSTGQAPAGASSRGRGE